MSMLKNIKMENKNYKDLPNNRILDEMSKLNEEFNKTKTLIINLTHHLDKVEKEYNKFNSEIKTRLGDE